MRRYPLCWNCGEDVDSEPLYEAVCGHDDCPSNVFHGLCLMEWREKRDEALRILNKFFNEHPAITEYRRPEDN